MGPGIADVRTFSSLHPSPLRHQSGQQKMSTVSPPPSNSSKENNSNIQKPPTKPRTRSNYHLESNPFEVSFSQPHTSPTIPTFAPPSPRLRSASGDGIESKPKLPPITAMASPAAAGDFAWAFGNGGTADVNSLRSGPLSPAMLAGPAQYSTSNGNPAGGPGAHHGGPGSGYDVMRTGLTPDVNRTGLTPLIGGPTSFPPPSPNTAAFIAMVTNQNNAAAVGATGQNGPDVAPATITPGTFSAITGALINNSNGPNGENGESTSPTSTHNPHHHPHRHPLSVSHVPDGVTDMNDDAAHTAANGLFLLSQAHHELTKREEQQQQQLTAQRQAQQQQLQPTQTRSTSSRDRSNSSPSTKRKITSASNDSNKRARASARAAPSRGGGRRKRSEEMSSNGDDDDDEQDDVDNDDVSDDEELEAAARVGTINASTKGHGSSSTPTKKPETEEEKRKNFLERNRQGSYPSQRFTLQCMCPNDCLLPPIDVASHRHLKCISLPSLSPHSSSLACCNTPVRIANFPFLITGR